MLSSRQQLVEMRHLAAAALAAYPLRDTRLRLVGDMENTTFRVDAHELGRHRASPPSGSRDLFLLRVHRPGRHGRGVGSVAAIGSELRWLTALRAQTHLLVPEPVATSDGEPTVTVSSATVPETHTCSLLRWMSGRIHTANPRPRHIGLLGAAMAQLHNHADQWVPPAGFVRIEWNWEAFFGNNLEYGGISASQCWRLLPRELRAKFSTVASRAERLMTRLGDGPDRVGLIHADLHLDNALFHAGGIRLIDFDDCGFGFRLYDVAVALWELRHRPDYPVFRDALVAGYTRHRSLPADDLAHVDTFIATRAVTFGLWFAGMAQVKPGFRDQLDHELAAIDDSLDVLLGG